MSELAQMSNITLVPFLTTSVTVQADSPSWPGEVISICQCKIILCEQAVAMLQLMPATASSTDLQG